MTPDEKLLVPTIIVQFRDGAVRHSGEQYVSVFHKYSLGGNTTVPSGLYARLCHTFSSLAYSNEHLKIRERTINIPRYLIFATHGMTYHWIMMEEDRMRYSWVLCVDSRNYVY